MSVKRGVGVYLFPKEYCFKVRVSLRAGHSPGRSGRGAGKGRRACNYVSGIEYLKYRKSRCEMLIGGDDISNDVSSIFHVFFNVFFYICTRFRFGLIGGKLTSQSTASQRRISLCQALR